MEPVLGTGRPMLGGTEERGERKLRDEKNYQLHFVYPMSKMPAHRVQVLYVIRVIVQPGEESSGWDS